MQAQTAVKRRQLPNAINLLSPRVACANIGGMNNDHIIDTLGGTGKLAEKLGVSGSTVSCWRTRGIPPTQLKLIFALFGRRLKKAGIGEDKGQPAEHV